MPFPITSIIPLSLHPIPELTLPSPATPLSSPPTQGRSIYRTPIQGGATISFSSSPARAVGRSRVAIIRPLGVYPKEAREVVEQVRMSSSSPISFADQITLFHQELSSIHSIPSEEIVNSFLRRYSSLALRTQGEAPAAPHIRLLASCYTTIILPWISARSPALQSPSSLEGRIDQLYREMQNLSSHPSDQNAEAFIRRYTAISREFVTRTPEFDRGLQIRQNIMNEPQREMMDRLHRCAVIIEGWDLPSAVQIDRLYMELTWFSCSPPTEMLQRLKNRFEALAHKFTRTFLRSNIPPSVLDSIYEKFRSCFRILSEWDAPPRVRERQNIVDTPETVTRVIRVVHESTPIFRVQ